MNLADARGLLPTLITGTADVQGDNAALERLADWCIRFSPWIATDGPDGLVMEASGVPHLYGGDVQMLEKIKIGLAGARITARIAMASTASAAWAWARYGEGGVLLEADTVAAISRLPVRAMRLEAGTIDRLNGLGIRSIADVARLPRAPLVRRLGVAVVDRLESVLGQRHDPISPRREAAPWRSRADMPEPIQTRPSIDGVLERLLTALCQLLEQDGVGVRKLALHSFRVDGETQTLRIGTSRATRDVNHLFRLFRDKLDAIEPGFGIETLILEAETADRLFGEQPGIGDVLDAATTDMARLLDRLKSRLPSSEIYRAVPLDSHCPERSVGRVSPVVAPNSLAAVSEDLRPVIMLPRPEAIDVRSDGTAFCWRRNDHKIALRFGPERLSSEWWKDGMDVIGRDYYRIEDESGKRYWLFRSRDGWFMHGIFA